MLGRQAEFKAASEENEKLKVILKLKLQTVEEENKRLWRLLKLMQSPVASHTIELSVLPDRPAAEGSDIEVRRIYHSQKCLSLSLLGTNGSRSEKQEAQRCFVSK
ncbi:hypothetical protein L208DRAFT_1379821 [Tricholoma matsutake]|nr:hypothetical protein L208DRAFT_1379821 [Tricholoma matsutake 945]